MTLCRMESAAGEQEEVVRWRKRKTFFEGKNSGERQDFTAVREGTGVESYKHSPAQPLANAIIFDWQSGWWVFEILIGTGLPAENQSMPGATTSFEPPAGNGIE